jgi:hypothetical protein
MGYAYYRYIKRMCEVIDADRYICVGFDELTQDPEATLERIYDHLCLPLSDEFRDRIRAAIADGPERISGHQYSLEEYGLSRQELYRELHDVFRFLGEAPDPPLSSTQLAQEGQVGFRASIAD